MSELGTKPLTHDGEQPSCLEWEGGERGFHFCGSVAAVNDLLGSGVHYFRGLEYIDPVLSELTPHVSSGLDSSGKAVPRGGGGPY